MATMAWQRSSLLSLACGRHVPARAGAAVAASLSWRGNSSTAAVLPVKNFGVVGAGQMGTGIAIVAARHAGLNVTAYDAFPESLERSRSFVANWAAKEVKKGRMQEADVAAFTDKIQYSSLEDGHKSISSLDFVVEAVSEKFEIKKATFEKLQELGLPTTAIAASNTSSISITRMAAVVERPERFIGMHFMNPVPVMKLVEIIRGEQTDDVTHATTLDLCSRMNKEFATSKDRPGFIANRILMSNLNMAITCLEQGIATKEDIDKIMKLGTAVPMGPLTLADFIGLDTVLNILRVLHAELGDQFRPATLLVNYVEAGWLGVKSKRGFYDYNK